ncbi:type III sulfide quinone reductase, selenoprotein subtype [Phycicoccus sonneratiae]|uniref:NAD(P)/FAD-dependent oxidoreductase n=1 Tax=Phycicoccus sonneratiae TaxID=2807628 RepID=A0ABS2CL22_9MICO|nr:FAD/NAD(P)-binding oxidoreductase [Phycicoccus sonneraticus]MBM6400597.1 NAD(P)/FAD-dependent oxidoreductase [Phycicoccus sonneraticus]
MTTPRNLVVLGAGTAGTMIVNKLRRRLPREDWSITVVDKDDVHDYQPGYLFIPFGLNTPDQIRRTKRPFIHDGVDLVMGEIERVDTSSHEVRLEGGRTLPYDQLVIATGTTPRPDQTEGTLGPQWHCEVGEFYTYEGALALRDRLDRFTGGRLVVHITELPIKCPVAPLEFTFLADDFLRQRGLRERTELVFVTPLDGAFTKPVASRTLGKLLEDKDIHVEPDFMVERIDQDRKVLVSYDEREVAYDQLVTVPLNMGADFVAASGLGDELNYVPVDKHTFLATGYDDVFALGDASNIPTSKAGSVAHFSVDVFVDNFVEHVAGRPMTHSFDGHANCFVESGHGKALLLDFNYDTEPLTGTFPLPKVGPMRLLAESRANHLGKLAFRHVYWNALLPGRPLGLPAEMSMSGKKPA